MKKYKISKITTSIICIIIAIVSYSIIMPLIQGTRNRTKMITQLALIQKADNLSANGEYKKAIEQYRSAINKIKDNTRLIQRAHNNLAWLYATCPDASLRNVDKAITHAKLADLTLWQDLDTLAAAYAEAGKFDDAVKTINMAISKAPESALPRLKKRRARYKKMIPFQMTNGI